MANDNPMGTNGFAFVEYSAKNKKQLVNLFSQMGFVETATHQSKDISIYQQNNIRFIINEEHDSFAQKFNQQHGPCACGMGFRVKDVEHAYNRALSLGAKPYNGNLDYISPNAKAIYGIGDSLLYFIDDKEHNNFEKHYYKPTGNKLNTDIGLICIDHLTHNVYQGNMDKWADFYIDLFNFRQIRYFDIQGKKTGLISRALASPCNKIKIPLNESKDDISQIAEYLKEYNGEGIQHIALTSENIYATVEKMRKNNVDFMDTPDTYFELIDKRLQNHGEDIQRMQKNKILIDGGPEQGGGFLLQIFTNTVIGPIFFEVIQRKGNEGFGEGNFQALFDSIELDQQRRGVI